MLYFDGAALYCESAEAQEILTSAPNNWVINNFMSGNDYNCTQPTITGVELNEQNGKKIMTVSGENLLYGIDEEYWLDNGAFYFALYGGSLVSVNNQPYNVCAENSGSTTAEWMEDDAFFVYDTAPCHYLLGPGGYDEPLITDAEFRIWLPDNFDMTAAGSVAVYDAPVYMFNQSAEGGWRGSPSGNRS